jgi:hypothetical protein
VKIKFIAIGVATAVFSIGIAHAAPAFKREAKLTDAMFTDWSVGAWKAQPDLRPDSAFQYLVAARRADGAVLVLTREPGWDDKKQEYTTDKIEVRGSFYKCGVLADWPSYVPIKKTSDVDKLLAKPLLDDKEERSLGIMEGSPVAAIYNAICKKK